ncbi:hypothetical protein BDAP_001770 [Binucleata daphniae]
MEDNEEFYCIDINTEGTLVVYGGNTDTLYIADFPSLKILHSIDDFTDSIIYTKFVESQTVIVFTLDGIIALLSLLSKQYTEYCRIDLEEDISKVEYKDSKFYVGTTKGSIHIFDTTFTDEIMLQGHNSAIQEIIICEDKLYTLSTSKFIIYDAKTHDVLYKRLVTDAVCMAYSDAYNIAFFASETDSYVVKDDLVLKRYAFSSEHTICVDNFFLVGGKGYYLNIINMASGCTYEQLKLNNARIEGITKIMNLGNNIIVFSTMCGKIVIGNFKYADTFKYYDSKVGVIYNFTCFYRHILVVGMFGVNIIHL